MYSNVLGLAFARPDSELTFTPDTLVVDKIKEESIKTTIAGILDIQSEWVRRFACQGKHL